MSNGSLCCPYCGQPIGKKETGACPKCGKAIVLTRKGYLESPF